MNQVLFIVAAAIAMTTGVVSLLIVATKASSDREARRFGSRRRTLSRRVDAYLRGERTRVGEALGDGIGSRDRAVVEDILLRGIIGREGTEFRKLARAFEELGLVALYLKNIERRGWWHRARAAENLGLVRVRRAQDALMGALQDENAEVRFRAARALGQIGDPAVMPTLILTLNEPERFSTIRMANVLVSVGAEINQSIMASFEELKPGARVAVLDVLSSIGSVETGPWLRERLKDDDSNVRSRAARALGAIGDLFSGPMLVEALKDPEWPVRAVAAKALATLRYAPAVPDLCVALRDSEWWVRSNAAESLRAMGEVGLTALESMLDDSDAYARHQAVFMLEEAGILDERVTDLFDASNRRRARSRTFVDRVIESGQCVRLSELAEGHADREVRTFLAHMLQEVRPPGDLADD
jgi:HEAT repeat protein